jgi:hypothetical protein
MANLPPVTDRLRRPLTVPVPSWLRDHHFDGRAMLPAVVALGLLAESTMSVCPGLSAATTREAAFARMLHLPEGATEWPAANEITRYADGSCGAALVTEHRSPTSGIRRSLVHVTCRFTGEMGEPGECPPAGAPAEALAVSAERVYADLVPFGPMLRNLRGEVHLWPEGALGFALARPLPDDAGPTAAAGSLLPLDAAFHLACAWGQRYHGWVAFPVGFARRTIHRPTRSGEGYRLWVQPLGGGAEGLRFHLRIDDAAGNPCETARDLCMRPLGGGRFKAPAWLRSPAPSP